MWLKQIDATAFRAYSKALWEFPQNGLVFVAGANNSGKSSLLATIDAIAGTDEGSPGARHHAQAIEETRIAARFGIEDSERQSVFGKFNGAGHEVRMPEAVEFVFQDSRGTLKISALNIELTPGWVVPYAFLDYDDENRHWVLKVLNAPSSGDEGADLSYSDQARFGQPRIEFEEVFGNSPELVDVWNLLQNWRSRYFHFRALRTGSQRTSNLSSEPTLVPSGINLPAVLLHLTTNRPALMAELRELMSEIVPDVGNLETPTSGNALEVAFSDPYVEGFRHNLKELGTGVEQLLMTLVVGLSQQTPCTLVIEEPETNLHPAAQRAMLGLLREWASTRLIVVATHSPVMLDRAGGRDPIYHVTRSAGASVVKKVPAEPLDLFSDLGVRLSDVLSADRILVVEGPSDEDVLAAWFPNILRDPRVVVIPGGGGDAARHANTLATWLERSDVLGRRVMFMRDRDELPAEMLASLSASPNIHVLERRELENYLLDAAAIAEVLGGLPSVREAPSADDVNASILQAAGELRSVVAVNRTVRRLNLIRLMDNKLRQNLAKRKAGPEEIKAEVISLIPDPESIAANIDSWWVENAEYVEGLDSDQLLRQAPGEEILDFVFLKYAKVRFKKTKHAADLAKAMKSPPEELSEILGAFMGETGSQ